MPKGYVFWLVFIVLLLFGGYWLYSHEPIRNYGCNFGIEMVLIGLLGWGIYGPAVK
jgi:hypothetical protein